MTIGKYFRPLIFGATILSYGCHKHHHHKRIENPREPVAFVRGDTNADRKVNLSDAIFINNYLFLKGLEPLCLKTADANDDGKVDAQDTYFLLNHLFKGGPPIPEPYPLVGKDPSEDHLSCDQYLDENSA